MSKFFQNDAMKKYIVIFLFLCSLALGTQLSFNSGQLSPKIKWRFDLDKRTMGAEELENVLVRAMGRASKRPGTEFIDETLVKSNVRLIPFEFSTDDSYVLELTDKSIGFFRTVP